MIIQGLRRLLRRGEPAILVEEGLQAIRLPDGRVVHARRVIAVGEGSIVYEDAAGQVRVERWAP
ncbi:MAG: hypothetical protein QXU69_07195 [Thermofilaceae archaeon]|nr:hypothetical protein [Armatimonadota bacterium]